MIYKEKLIRCQDGRLYLSTQLDLDKAYPFVRIVCEKNQFRMERTSSAAIRGCDIVIEPRISCKRILIPQAIVDAYGFTKSPTINMEKKANGDCCYKAAMFRSPNFKPLTKPIPFTERLDDTKMSKEKAVRANGVGSEKLKINGLHGLLRVDVYAERCRMIVVRKYDAVRDANTVHDYQYLTSQYGAGLYNLPRGDFSFSTNVIGNQGLPLYRAITRMLETDKDTVYRVYETSNGVALVPEDVSCAICGNTINMKEEAPITVYTDKEIAQNPSLLLPYLQDVERLESTIDQLASVVESQRVLLTEKDEQLSVYRKILGDKKPQGDNQDVRTRAKATNNRASAVSGAKIKISHAPKSSKKTGSVAHGTTMPVHHPKTSPLDEEKIERLRKLAAEFDEIDANYSIELIF